MKLISCYIKNFGKLSSKEYIFNDGINSFIKENGSGKSTLASFIKAMLYGMDKVKINDKDFKDRIHYLPFNEQSYGGTLIFEHNNKEYRIERSFDEKTNVKDRLTIYVDKEKTKFDKEIGEEILGLDRESFERLLFITSNDMKLESNGNIKKNLNNIIDDTIEGVDYETIINNIKEVKKSYKPLSADSKKIKDKKNDLENRINNQKITSKSLKEKYNTYNEILNKEREYLNKQSIYNDSAALFEKKKNYQNKLDDIEKKNKELNSLLSLYPFGYPNDDELSTLTSYFEKRNILLWKSKNLIFDSNKLKERNRLNDIFFKGVPNDEEMKELDYLYEENANLISQNKYYVFKEEDLNKLNKYKEIFKDGVPLNEEIEVIKLKIEEYDKCLVYKNAFLNNNINKDGEDLINIYSNKNYQKDLNTLTQLVTQYKEIEANLASNNINNNIKYKKLNLKKKFIFIFLALGIIFLISGVSLLFINKFSGIILTSLSPIFLIISLFLYLYKRNKNNKGCDNDDYLKLIRNLKELETKIKNILLPYKIDTVSIYYDYEKFKDNINKYDEIINKKDLFNNENNDVKISNLKNELNSFFNKYLLFNSFKENLILLKESINEYQKLNHSYKEFLSIKQSSNINLSQNNDSINKILNKYGLNTINLSFNLFKKDVSDLKRLNNEYNQFLLSKQENEQQLESINTRILEIDNKYKLDLLSNTHFLDEIKSNIKEINMLTKEFEIRKKDAIEYAESNNLDLVEFNDDEIKDYKEDLEKIKNLRINLEFDIDNCERDIDDLEDNLTALKDLNDKIHQRSLYLDTLELVEYEIVQAQKDLDNKYVSPIMNKFKYYLSFIGDILEAKLEMDRDFNLKINVKGELKSDEHLSSGQRSICALCLKLAFLDNIYNEDVPFIVMDDPFTNLDAKNIIAVKNLIEQIIKDKQIIYFSCHQSRAI